ncbi:hypothetical protein WJX81_005178 [Elliptochloris bilobata]|uniref:Uncharacterized protein n=1 Tax=Elliptochloris bilobata TaxID=381761 RepID=A0AAW1RI20_9CHLO
MLCSRLSAAASAAAFMLAELVYVGLHAKPLAPLLPGRGAGRADRAFLRTYTTAAYFSSELALLALVASVSPARAALPRAVAGVHCRLPPNLRRSGARIHGYSKKEQGKRKADVKAQHKTYSRHMEDKVIPEEWLEEKEQLKEMLQELGLSDEEEGGGWEAAAAAKDAKERRLPRRWRTRRRHQANAAKRKGDAKAVSVATHKDATVKKLQAKIRELEKRSAAQLEISEEATQAAPNQSKAGRLQLKNLRYRT